MTDAALEKPPLFAAEGLAAAGARALEAGRWLIVDATARWCQPCKLMDRTTWRDPGVEAWIAGHAVAIQVDVDADEAIARELAIGAMPTVIAIREGKEQDRVVGYRTAAALLEWLSGLERGESSIDQLRRSIPDPDRDMQGRLRVAQALLHARRLDEAASEYVWLWHNIARVEPGMLGVRVSFMAGAIATLVEQHDGARAQFTALRDGAEAQAGRDRADRDARFDWLVLNEVLGDDERTVAWFDAVKHDPSQADVVEHAAHRLVPKLEERERWADIGRIYRDPLA
ncbi:MAG TPA: thioredoxin family protein, partial [Actinomycetota bacterium]|nr:thioredoxin family protein [Actinomycetota bacterium]